MHAVPIDREEPRAMLSMSLIDQGEPSWDQKRVADRPGGAAVGPDATPQINRE